MTLRDLREARGLSQQAVTAHLNSKGSAYRSGRALVSAWECGKATPPTGVLSELAVLYKVSLSKVLAAINETAREVRTSA